MGEEVRGLRGVNQGRPERPWNVVVKADWKNLKVKRNEADGLVESRGEDWSVIVVEEDNDDL